MVVVVVVEHRMMVRYSKGSILGHFEITLQIRFAIYDKQNDLYQRTCFVILLTFDTYNVPKVQ